jgi:hypothetical protein
MREALEPADACSAQRGTRCGAATGWSDCEWPREHDAEAHVSTRCEADGVRGRAVHEATRVSEPSVEPPSTFPHHSTYAVLTHLARGPSVYREQARNAICPSRGTDAAPATESSSRDFSQGRDTGT